jgi:hypothetical protein
MIKLVSALNLSQLAVQATTPRALRKTESHFIVLMISLLLSVIKNWWRKVSILISVGRQTSNKSSYQFQLNVPTMKELNKNITVLGLAYLLNKCVLCTATIVKKKLSNYKFHVKRFI